MRNDGRANSARARSHPPPGPRNDNAAPGEGSGVGGSANLGGLREQTTTTQSTGTGGLRRIGEVLRENRDFAHLYRRIDADNFPTSRERAVAEAALRRKRIAAQSELSLGGGS
jgi:hypothetical protein